jgi:hypothetical protein
VPTPHLRLEDTGETYELTAEVTTVGRGEGVDIVLDDPSVSRLHAELVRAGPTSTSATSGCRRTAPASTAGRSGGGCCSTATSSPSARPAPASAGRPGGRDDTKELRRMSAPDLTRRECEVLSSLCRPALLQDAFVAPARPRDIAEELVVTEAAVKQHLLRLT